MNLLSDIITYVRRLIKSPSDALITDNPSVPPMSFEMTPTMEALIEYGQGKTIKIDFIKKFLSKKV